MKKPLILLPIANLILLITASLKGAIIFSLIIPPFGFGFLLSITISIYSLTISRRPLTNPEINIFLLFNALVLFFLIFFLYILQDGINM